MIFDNLVAELGDPFEVGAQIALEVARHRALVDTIGGQA